MTQLNRETFRTSRMMDFFSRKELVAQIGYPVTEWPLVVAKELLDNALDGCEDAGEPPEITIKVDPTGITVTDNGPGIPASTVEGVLDFEVRVSSREAYVSPTRGAQGNALKTIIAMPFVLDGEQGHVEIEARGVHHDIRVGVDRIRQEPAIHYEPTPTEIVRSGTSVKIHWPDLPKLDEADPSEEFGYEARDASDDPPDLPRLLCESRGRFLQFAEDYTWLNPHLTLTVDWCGTITTVQATDPAWKKWRSNQPTPAHWYTPERLSRLIAATVAHDQTNDRHDRTVREFVSQFDGLSGSAKQGKVLAATGLARCPVTDLLNEAGDDLNHGRVEALLSAMKAETKPVKARRLGLIGKDHFEKRFASVGGDPETFAYQKVIDDSSGKPEIVEMAFGYCPGEDRDRRLVTGVNWSPGIGDPFRTMGEAGESLSTLLQRRRVEWSDPVIYVMHYACPRVEYTDRGKSAVALEWN